MGLTLILATLLLLCAYSSATQDSTMRGELYIVEPSSLYNVSIETTIALFSKNPPSEPEEFDLIAADPLEACTPIVNDVYGKAVLVNRGNCSLYQKAAHVEKAGGVACL